MDLPQEVPVMTLPQTVLFPNALLPLHIFEPRYRRMLGDTLATHRMFAVAMQRPGPGTRETPCPVAGLGLIRAAVTQPDGTSNLVLQGLARVELGAALRYRPYRVHVVRRPPAAPADPLTVAPLATRLRGLVSRRLEQGIELPPPIVKKLEQLAADHLAAGSPLPGDPPPRETGPGLLADLVSCTLLTSATRRQALLETWDVETRLRQVIRFLTEEIEQQEKGSP